MHALCLALRLTPARTSPCMELTEPALRCVCLRRCRAQLGQTPLHRAAQDSGAGAAVRALLNAGANKDATTGVGWMGARVGGVGGWLGGCEQMI